MTDLLYLLNAIACFRSFALIACKVYQLHETQLGHRVISQNYKLLLAERLI